MLNLLRLLVCFLFHAENPPTVSVKCYKGGFLAEKWCRSMFWYLSSIGGFWHLEFSYFDTRQLSLQIVLVRWICCNLNSRFQCLFSSLCWPILDFIFFQPVLKRHFKLLREQRVLEVIGGPEGTKMCVNNREYEKEGKNWSFHCSTQILTFWYLSNFYDVTHLKLFNACGDFT